MADDIVTEVCEAFDVPVWMIVGSRRPRLFRVRWAMRRWTGFTGQARRG